MIRLFKKDETNFDSNGLGVLDPAIKENVVEEKMNGIYNFDFAYLSKGKHASQLEGDMIIKVPTPDGDQLFRVYKVTKNIGFLEVNCYHIFYDLAGNFIEDINIVSQSGQAAITHFGTGLQYATRFKFVSNIVGTNSARMVRLNAVQALLDSSQDNSFLSRWGGEIKRDNFTVYMNDVRGNDKGFKIRHGKNLTGYEANIDYSTVVTRIMPYGYNGLMLPEKYVDSPLRDKYAFTRIKKIEYTNIKAIDPDATSNDESAVPLEEAYKLLRQAAELEYSVNKVDIPTSNFKVTFKNLSDTKEYADFKALEKVEPWDYVTVIADNLDIKSRMISYKYDAITKSYKEVELGNYVPSFTDIGSKVDHATNLANQANDTANTAAESANGKNSNYYGPNEPSRPVDGDLWYKKNGDKTELWQYDGKSVPPGWKLIVDDATGEEVRQNVDAAQKEAEEAKTQADDAVGKANQAVEDAGFANSTASDAKTAAANAQKDATGALSDALSAQSEASAAISQASSAAADSKDAKQIAGAVSQSYKTLTDGSTMTIAELESGLAVKLTKTDLDGYATEDWTQNQIKMTADGINGTMSSIKSTVDGQTTSINDLKADSSSFKSQFTTVNNTLGKQTTDIGSLQASSKELTSGFNTLTTDNTTNKNDISQLKQTATEVSSTLETVQTQVQDSAVGTNLLTGTSEDESSGKSYLFTDYQISGGLQPGTTYTLSGWARLDQKAMDNQQHVFICAYTSDWSWVGQLNIDGSLTGKHNKVTFTTPNGIPFNLGVTVYLSHPNNDSSKDSISGTGYISKIKLEKGSLATDWCPNPADNATVTAVSKLSQTVNGIQTTVSGKADQSQITQLSDQLTSKITDVNSSLSSQITQTKNDINLRLTSSQVQSAITTSILNDKRIKDTRNDNQLPSWYYANYPSQVVREFKLGNALGITESYYVSLETDVIWSDMSGGMIKQTAKGDQQTWQRFAQGTSAWGAWATVADTSNVISQINISPESILIAGQKVHITGQTTIDNAVIKDAMIADIKADKITAGTLNAANVNVINLNANNITTGTLKGTNLSMNLNTGEVLFQKGSIKSANGNLNLDISKGTMAVINEYKSGFYFEDGKLVLNDGWLEGTSSQPKYGSLEYNANYFTVNGLAVKGTEGVTIGTPGYNPLAMFSSVKESGIAIDKKHLEIGSVGPTIISSGNRFFMNLLTQSPFIAVGTTTDGSYMTTSDPGSRISLYAEYVHIKSAYSKTASGSANLIVSEDGALVRSTSASKYKMDIIRTNIPDYGEKLLELPTATWTDIAETKRYRDDPTNQIKPTRNFGMIAEDLAEAGLEMLVVRGTDGELEGINYDRIGPALIPVIAKLKNEVETLKQQLEEKTA
ncbi:phage tail spike protein (plasmid) [Latilactobacillus curvatus]|uniref:phage tail spike protein n=1 Tax=Latilactobacillus curvatus TaxID=28038 RepID=UPI0024B9F3CA|nr:phage tail spike protein [Latilactobacillus curvatus]WHQ77613.1 phage tail spike protein [Latilactobacillus curvatus]WHQ78874.1 phage tail spike protein [Latilactobacillus curvatus]WHQ79292.1 phage tail spike protein [Latilactobacillus curvatus]